MMGSKRSRLCILTLSAAAAMSINCWRPTKPTAVSDQPTPIATSTATPDRSPSNSSMANSSNASSTPAGFFGNVVKGFVKPTDEVGNRLLKEYGAIFVARGGARPPTEVVFRDASAVSSFQNSLERSTENVGGVSIELQAAAMKALLAAVSDAKAAGKNITPRGADAARRDYSGTVDLWRSRVEPGLSHWIAKGRLSSTDAERIRALSPFEQVPEIFKLEAQGMFFAKDLSKSIIYSVAPPGTSQHLAMLAIDITEHDDAAVRKLMEKHGWYQTVVSDLPHFTFLGVSATELPGLGLKLETNGGRDYWLPQL